MKAIIVPIFILFLISYSFGQEVELLLQNGHTDRVTCADYSKSGEYVVTGGMDQMIKLWEVKTGLLVRTFKGHKGMVYDIAISPDEKSIYSASADDLSMIKWDLKTGAIQDKQLFRSHSISDFILSKDGKSIFAAGKDTILVLNADFSLSMKIPLPDVDKLVVSPDGNIFYAWSSFSSNYKISAFSTSNFVKLKEYDGISSVLSMSISDDKLLVSNYEKIVLLNLTNGKSTVIAKRDSVNFCSTLLLPKGDEILGSNSKGELFRYKLDGTKSLLSTEHRASVNELILSHDERYVLTASNDWSSQIIDLNSGKCLKNLSSSCDYIYDISYEESNTKVFFSAGNNVSGNQILFWNLLNARLVANKERTDIYSAFTSIDYNEKLSSTICANTDGMAYWYNFPKSPTSFSFMSDNSRAKSVALSPNGKNGIVGTVDGKLIYWRPDRNKMETIQLSEHGISSLKISPNGTKIAVGLDNGQLVMVDYELKSILSTIESHTNLAGYSDTSWVMAYGSMIHLDLFGGNSVLNAASVMDIDYSNTGDSLVTCGGNWVNLFSASGKLIKRFEVIGAGFGCVDLRSDGKKILASGSNGFIYLFDCISGKVELVLEGHQNEVRDVSFTKNSNFILSASMDAQMKIWDISKRQELLSFVSAFGGTEFVIYNPQGYYFASKGANKLLTFRIGQQILPFDQFDIKYNRPDIIINELSRFTTATFNIPVNSRLIDSYKKAYMKRLEKMQFSEKNLPTDFNAPKISIISGTDKLSTIDSLHTFSVDISDLNHPLQSLHVLVNGVPAFGTKGIALKGNQLNQQVTIELNQGINKVQFYGVNSKGIKSLTEGVEIVYTVQKREPVTYFIGIGVQKYADSSFNLKYSAKDIEDVNKLLSENRKHLKSFILTNENVTRESVLKIKKELLKSDVDDEVIILMSGHGVLSDELDFYYATHDMDFNNPASKGILFEEIESLLNDIPARKKVLLIDACHSGEVDKVEATEGLNPKGIDTQNVGSKGQKMVMGLGNSFELMKELFSDLQKGTGTTIIASSSGKYFSYEFDSYKNGVFTYALKEAFNGMADSNQNGELSVSELQTYLTKRVSALTKGKQEPTSRQTNYDLDWVVVKTK